ncbi:OsmC family protein [Microbacterium sp. No. 7]|uniref:OsmC family protein n=1 Tax=Microbacterium sp. No. 7 TaxID=1714373 RepID=UPI0006ED3DE5|nr:OsmC family protein [Microbacterium sp. No. 7]ALJ18920.1 osmotically inducible protein OsmC [Microbacterium sp. No. 7]
MSTSETLVRTDVPEITAAERGERLRAAGAAWSDRIDADRTSAHLTFRATGSGEGAVASRVRAGRYEFVVDEPAPLGGDDVAPNPVEYALGALIGCQIVVYRLYAEVLGIPFDDIRITAEGDLDAARLLGKDDTVRPGFQAVRLRVELTGPESAERYEQLRSAVDANCPVGDLFQNATPVTSELV